MSCEETNAECLAARQARVRQVIADNQYATQKELAELANVSLRTIEREIALLQNPPVDGKCNSAKLQPLPPTKPLPLGQQPEVLAAIQALGALTKQQRKPVLYWIETFWKVKAPCTPTLEDPSVPL